MNIQDNIFNKIKKITINNISKKNTNNNLLNNNLNNFMKLLDEEMKKQFKK